MAERETALREMLAETSLCVDPVGLPRPSPSLRHLLRHEVASEIHRVYRALGGIGEQFPINTGAWDMEVGGIAVELDEERHFNRYREITLASTLYSDSRFPRAEYQRYCKEHEAECIASASFGGYWSNPSTIVQFGPAGPKKDLSGAGAPRWKQRAFYDFMKDLSPLMAGTRVARVAIWDTVRVEEREMKVRDVLDRRIHGGIAGIVRLLEERSGVRFAAV